MRSAKNAAPEELLARVDPAWDTLRVENALAGMHRKGRRRAVTRTVAFVVVLCVTAGVAVLHFASGTREGQRTTAGVERAPSTVEPEVVAAANISDMGSAVDYFYSHCQRRRP